MTYALGVTTVPNAGSASPSFAVWMSSKSSTMRFESKGAGSVIIFCSSDIFVFPSFPGMG